MTRYLLSLFLLLCLANPGLATGIGNPATDGNIFTSRAESFLPVDEAYRVNIDLGQGQLIVAWELADNYFLYRHAFANEVILDGKLRKLEAALPAGEEKLDEYFGKVEIYHNQVLATSPLPSPTEPFLLKATSQGCADAGLCYPPYSLYFSIDPLSRAIKEIPAEEFTLAAKPLAGDIADEESPGLVVILLFALLGGMILNLMPCVFPVLSIKVMQLARQHDQKVARQQGLAYLAGVVTSFILVAAIMLALRAGGLAIGWGFQLQNPWFIALLVYLFFILGLGMSGALAIGQKWMGVGQSLTEKSGLAGAFFTGVLAVVVASPCTAPFMGSALGYAITRPDFIALLVFATLGLGMAMPMVLVSFIPSASRLLPRPGHWMERLKQFFAFPLYATAAWLLWILGNQTTTTGMLAILLGCIGMVLAFWCFKSRYTAIRLCGIAILFAALAVPFSAQLQRAPETVVHEQQAFTTARLADLRRQGKPVFVNLTADWCITCIANEKTTLGRDEVQLAFKEAGIVYMVGDWTHFNPEITALLSEYNRSGIPLYLLYPPIADAPAIILPQLLTPQIVLDSINNIKVSTN